MEKLEPGTKVKVGQHEAEIIKYLAQGGFAYIYLVHYSPVETDQEEDDVAALKRVIVRTKPELNLLRKEVETMQRLSDNKYVVKYLDSNAQKLQDGTYEVLLLMEYCPNKSLLDYMNLHLKSKLAVTQILKIMYQISIGLSSMHYANMIHRDLKIENVLIDKHENFKLCDFGSTSNFINPPTNQEEFNNILNDIIHQTTPQYRAPEMIDLYKNLPIDNKSDIWALGVFLYKLMYYTTPFEHQGDLAILHGYFQFPELPKYPSRMKNLVIIMLQVNPSLRPNIYQVLAEICGQMKEEIVPIKDIYGLGVYDYQAYEQYQQHLVLQQQQQQAEQFRLQQEQQKMYQQQQQAVIDEKILREQHKESSVEIEKRQRLSEEFLKSERVENPLLVQSHELTKSGNTSSVCLTTHFNGIVHSESLKDIDDTESIELENVEERFPDLDDLENADTVGDLSRIKSSTSNKSETVTLDHETNSNSFPEIGTTTNRSDEEMDHPGLKYTKTEAWVNPNDSKDRKDSTDETDFHISGVFHRQSTSPVEEGDSKTTNFQSQNQDCLEGQPVISKRQNSQELDDEFDDLFSNIKTNGKAAGSKNPFPVITSLETSKNPFPIKPSSYTEAQTLISDLKLQPPQSHIMKPQVSGGNPWASYTASTTSQSQINYSSTSTQIGHHQREWDNLQNIKNQEQIIPLKNSQFSLNHHPSSYRPVVNSNNFHSPNITVSTDEQLIDLGVVDPKQNITKFINVQSQETNKIATANNLNLDLVEASDQCEDYKKTDSDSDGELIIEEMELGHSKDINPRQQNNNKKKLSFDTGINGLKFDLEELDLNDDNVITRTPSSTQNYPGLESTSDDENNKQQQEKEQMVIDDAKHSRKSFELIRPLHAAADSRSNSVHTTKKINIDSVETVISELNGSNFLNISGDGTVENETKNKNKKKDELIKSKRRSFLGF